MESIENYKKRFFNLMESTIGDVRPLIIEQQLSPDKIKEYKAKWSVSNVLKNEKSKEMYQTAIVNGNLIPKETTEDSQVLAIYQNTLNDGSVGKMVIMYDMSHNTKSSELGKSPITKADELGDIILLSDKSKKENEWCKKRNLSPDDICVVTKSMDEETNNKKYDMSKYRIEKTGKYKKVEEDLNIKVGNDHYSYGVWKKIA
jgi:hypothetical protein